LVFDSDVSAGAPALSRINAKDPLPTSVGQVSPTAVDILWTLSVPEFTNLYSSDAGLIIDFDNPVNANAPGITPKESAVDPTVTGVTQLLPAQVRVDWTPGGSPPVNLLPPPVATSFEVSVVFDTPMVLTAAGLLPSSWTFSPVGLAFPITCSAVTPDIDGVTVHLTVSLMTIGVANYTLHLLGAVVESGIGGVDLPGDYLFDGFADPLTIVSATVSDPDTVIIAFSAPPDYTSALTPGNYSIDNGLSVVTLTPVLPNSVRVDTSEMTPGVTYTLTISNVTDPAGNPLV
jgi:hypothetical protein